MSIPLCSLFSFAVYFIFICMHAYRHLYIYNLLFFYCVCVFIYLFTHLYVLYTAPVAHSPLKTGVAEASSPLVQLQPALGMGGSEYQKKNVQLSSYAHICLCIFLSLLYCTSIFFLSHTLSSFHTISLPPFSLPFL